MYLHHGGDNYIKDNDVTAIPCIFTAIIVLILSVTLSSFCFVLWAQCGLLDFMLIFILYIILYSRVSSFLVYDKSLARSCCLGAWNKLLSSFVHEDRQGRMSPTRNLPETARGTELHLLWILTKTPRATAVYRPIYARCPARLQLVSLVMWREIKMLTRCTCRWADTLMRVTPKTRPLPLKIRKGDMAVGP